MNKSLLSMLTLTSLASLWASGAVAGDSGYAFCRVTQPYELVMTKIFRAPFPLSDASIDRLSDEFTAWADQHDKMQNNTGDNAPPEAWKNMPPGNNGCESYATLEEAQGRETSLQNAYGSNQARIASWQPSPPSPTNTKLASNPTQGTTKAPAASNPPSGDPAADGFAYRPNLNKCIHFDRDPGSLYFENSCKASVTVSWYQLPRTNNSSWGTSDCGPASKCVVGINGVNYERSTDFHIAACPKGFDSVLMNGNQWTDNGPFRCRTMLKK
jgi:hypothetical protein